MTSYALMKNGIVYNMVQTQKSITEVSEAWPGYEVVLESRVPLAALENYEFWDERP